MGQAVGNIKVLVATEVPITEAIKAVLGRNGVSRFASERGFPRPNVSACINGGQRHDRVREALAEELGVTRSWLDEHLDALSAPADIGVAE